MRCLIRKKTIPRQTTLLDGRAFIKVVVYVVVVQRRIRIHTARKEGLFIKGVRLFVTHKAQTMKTHTRILMRILPRPFEKREKKSEKKASNISRDIFMYAFFDTLNKWTHKTSSYIP